MRKTRFLFPLGVALSVLLIAGTVLAATVLWLPSTLNPVGEITVTAPVSINATVTLTGLDFGVHNTPSGTALSYDANVTIGNPTTQAITNVDVAQVGTLPDGLLVTLPAIGPIGAGGNVVATFTVHGTPMTQQTINMSAISFTLTPH